MKRFDKFILFYDTRIKPVLLWTGCGVLLVMTIAFLVSIAPDIWRLLLKLYKDLKTNGLQYFLIGAFVAVISVIKYIAETWYTERVGRIRREKREAEEAKSELK